MSRLWGSLFARREIPSEVAMRGAIRDGLCTNQVDAKFARRAVVQLTRRARGEFGNALVLEVVGERTKGDVERHARLRGEMPMTERRGEEVPGYHTKQPFDPGFSFGATEP